MLTASILFIIINSVKSQEEYNEKPFYMSFFFKLLVIIKTYYTQANMKSKLHKLKVTNTIIISISIYVRDGKLRVKGGMGGGGWGWGVWGGREWSLGGRWWRGRLFKLSSFAAFTEFSVHNHFPGDAGHLTVGHCVGSVPATQRNNL